MPLPEGVETFLLSQQGAISKMLVRERGDKEDEEETDVQEGTEGGSAESEGPEGQQEARQLSPEEFWTELERLLNKAGGDWTGAADRVWSFGPKRVGANLLLDPVGTKHLRLRRREQLFTQARAQGQSADDALLSTDHAVAADQLASLSSTTSSDNEAARAELRLLRDYESSIETGFQLSTFQGPLCAEPVVGMAWVVENVELDKQGMESEQGKGQVVGGALISAVRDACRQGLLDWSPRIKLAMYTCDIQASTDVLGKVYGVVARRRGRIVSEEMKEGTSFFTIRSMLPVVESFGFADEIRTRTSGAASPQLIFSGYETLDLDPFWVPTTQEELEDLGEKADKANVAKAYVDGVRKRKGMFVERKIVEFAEKQRTLKK